MADSKIYIKSLHSSYIQLSVKRGKYEQNNSLTDTFDIFTGNKGGQEGADDDLYAAIECLSECQKTIILSRYYQGYKMNEIAATLGMSRQSVHKKHKIALVNLRSMLN